MKDFQRLLEECLRSLSTGTVTVDECLARYPAQAGQLELLLKTAALLNRGRDVLPSPTFTAYTRSSVLQYTRTHSRGARNMFGLYQRAALTFTMLVVTLLGVGTAHAQSALPGESFYPWKRNSELVWRAVSFNPVTTDILLAERRLNEWIAVADDPTLSEMAMNSYLEALESLTSLNFSANLETLTIIVPALQSQQETLSDAGLSASALDEYLVEAASFDVVVQATSTEPAPTLTLVPTQVEPTNTPIPTEVEPTSTPTPTEVEPTETPTPTPTEVEPTETPTPTEVDPTETPTPTEEEPTSAPTELPPTD